MCPVERLREAKRSPLLWLKARGQTQPAAILWVDPNLADVAEGVVEAHPVVERGSEQARIVVVASAGVLAVGDRLSFALANRGIIDAAGFPLRFFNAHVAAAAERDRFRAQRDGLDVLAHPFRSARYFVIDPENLSGPFVFRIGGRSLAFVAEGIDEEHRDGNKEDNNCHYLYGIKEFGALQPSPYDDEEGDNRQANEELRKRQGHRRKDDPCNPGERNRDSIKFSSGHLPFSPCSFLPGLGQRRKTIGTVGFFLKTSLLRRNRRSALQKRQHRHGSVKMARRS